MRVAIVRDGVVENVLVLADDAQIMTAAALQTLIAGGADRATIRAAFVPPDGTTVVVLADALACERGWLADGEGFTAPVPVSPPITADDVLAAKRRVANFADSLAAQVTGPVPETERASWPTKELAARAYLDGAAPGTATAIQVAMLTAEANLTGETLAALAQKIVDNADAYVAIAGMIAGQRRVTIAALDALEIGVATIADIEAVLATARTQAETMLVQVLGT